MLVASIEPLPGLGGKASASDADGRDAGEGREARRPGVERYRRGGGRFWTALQGRRALRVTWDEGPMVQVSSTMITREYEAAAKQPGQVARNDGDAEKVLGQAGGSTSGSYQVRFLEHAYMEPMNATAQGCPTRAWSGRRPRNPGGTQSRRRTRLTGLPPKRSRSHRRTGAAASAGAVSRTSSSIGRDVQGCRRAGEGHVTREDDITHGLLSSGDVQPLPRHSRRSACLRRVHADGRAGNLITERGARRPAPSTAAAVEASGTGLTTSRTSASNGPTRTSASRSGSGVGRPGSKTVHHPESLIDELAHLAGKDPYEYRRALPGQGATPQGGARAGGHQSQLGGAAANRPCARLAVAFSYGSTVAHVAEVSVAGTAPSAPTGSSPRSSRLSRQPRR